MIRLMKKLSILKVEGWGALEGDNCGGSDIVDKGAFLRYNVNIRCYLMYEENENECRRKYNL